MRVTHPTRPPPRAPAGEPLLSVEGACVGYGAAADVVRDVTLEVRRGEAVALVGANGAGKTTLLRAIARRLPLRRGRVSFDGDDAGPWPTEVAVARGISLVPEGRHVFAPLSVRENLELGAFHHRHAPSMRESFDDLVALFPRLGERLTQPAGTLSGGEQQMLAIARALMARPSLLLLDEPSLGIAPKLAEQLFEAIGAVARAGVTVLLVEQNTRLALASSARAYVLREGRIALTGPSASLADDPDVRRAYFGNLARPGLARPSGAAPAYLGFADPLARAGGGASASSRRARDAGFDPAPSVRRDVADVVVEGFAPASSWRAGAAGA
jgi:branched-chain amino acid transport system ATP-binding protein